MIVLNKDGVAYLWEKIRSSFAPKTEVPRGMAGMRWDTTGTQVDIPYMEIDEGGSVREYGTRRHTVSVGRVAAVEPLDGTAVHSEPVFTVTSQAALASMAQKTAWKVFVDSSGTVTEGRERIPCCSYEVGTFRYTLLILYKACKSSITHAIETCSHIVSRTVRREDRNTFQSCHII